MSKVYGPYSGTVNTIFQVDVAPATRVIQVRNDTPYDLFVAYGPGDEPQPITTTQGQWNYVVPAWDHPVIPAGPGSAGVSLAAGGAFDGRVYLLPITAPGQLATAGTASARNSIYVVAFEPNDYIPAGSSLPRQADVTNQTRIVVAGLGPFALKGSNVPLTAPGQDIMLRTDGFAASGPPAIPGTTDYVANMYLYFCHFRINIPSANNFHAADVTLYGDLMNGASVVTSVALHQIYTLSANLTSFYDTRPDDFEPSVPAVDGVSGFALPVTGVRWRLHVNAITAQPNAYWNIGVGLDINNSYSPGTHGNFTQDIGAY